MQMVLAKPSDGGVRWWYGIQFPPLLRFFRSPVSSLLEYSGFFRLRPDFSEAEPLVLNRSSSSSRNASSNGAVSATRNNSGSDGSSNLGNGEVSIRIIGAGEGDRVGAEVDDDEEDGVGLGLGSVDENGRERGLGSGAAAVDCLFRSFIKGGFEKIV